MTNERSSFFASRFGRIALSLAVTLMLVLAACSGGSSIVGTWTSEDGREVLIFEDDGTCSVPFTYNAGWLEDCDRYAVKDDGTLILSSSKGNISSRKYEKAESAEEAEEDSSLYFLSGDKLVINEDVYER